MTPLPQYIVGELAKPRMRLGHLLWHSIRDYWMQLSAKEQQGVTALNPEYAPPDVPRDEYGQPTFSENAGRDFLYCHRVMVEMVNTMLAMRGHPPVQPWQVPPAADDPNWPAVRELNFPPGSYIGKDDAKWTAIVDDAMAQLQPDSLRRLSIGQLGVMIESNIHAAMHQRWGGSTPIGTRLVGHTVELTVPEKWNDPKYDTLLDSYAAHLHPTFWMIHGWIDAQIDAWQAANGLTQIDWGDPWIGPMDMDDDGGECGCGCGGAKKREQAKLLQLSTFKSRE